MMRLQKAEPVFVQMQCIFQALRNGPPWSLSLGDNTNLTGISESDWLVSR